MPYDEAEADGLGSAAGSIGAISTQEPCVAPVKVWWKDSWNWTRDVRYHNLASRFEMKRRNI